ncbi:uncharacterized protein [Apostichopus japonicus]|uniref:uncharacterized protein n=1 Tax=Stichopus japonicus TaxID=307972 RepID=UPI003AB75DF3
MRCCWNISWMLLLVHVIDHVSYCVGVYVDHDRSNDWRTETADDGDQPLPFSTQPNTNRYVVETEEEPDDPDNDQGTDSGSAYNPDDLQMGCTELRSKRYISDGFCTSVRPITEVVCAGECLPLQYLPNYAAYQKTWSREKTREWRCVDDVIRYRNVNLLCQNGEQRKYRIPTVKGCKCKRYNRRHNESDLPPNDSRQAISRPEPVSDDRRADRRASKRRNRNQ